MSVPSATMPGDLFERVAELDAVRRSVAQAKRKAGGLVLIDGPAGAGKTVLLDAARSAAEAEGLLILKARGAELERAFAFGVVHQLFDD